MYIPAQFKEQDPDTLFQMIEHCPLGTLITHSEGTLDAIHVPFEIKREVGEIGCLIGHVARANPVWRSVANGDEVLVVFRGGDAYISPNWYPSKQQTHRQVPTWNYRAVHVRGQITFRQDESFLRDVVAKLTKTHESTQPIPWSMEDAPADYISAMLKAIVGVEIKILQITGAMKLGQNKNADDLRSAGENVINAGNKIIGEAMLSHLKIKNSR